MELDYGVGQILQTLKTLNIEENTFVFFTSDNGAAITSKTKSKCRKEIILCNFIDLYIHVDIYGSLL